MGNHKGWPVYQTLKETEKALELYKRAYDMTSPQSYDRDGVLERLIPLLKDLRRDAEADALIKREEQARKAMEEEYSRYDEEETGFPPALDEQKPMRVISKKIGRNEPCPCGSGKKYKKCCGK